MRLDLIEGIRLLIVALLAYIPTVTISGWFTAWVAKRCDDELPERLGFLTLDPFAHISIFGFAILLIGELFGNYLTFFKHIPGFGRFIILDPQPTNSKIKVIAEFFARSLAHFVMLTCSFLVLFAIFKNYWLVPSNLLPAEAGSLLLSCKDVLFYFFRQNIALCGIYFLFGLADTVCFFWNIPRMFSAGYFLVLIGVLLFLGGPVDYCLSSYIKVSHNLLLGFFHA